MTLEEILKLQNHVVHAAINWHHHPDHGHAMLELHETVAEFMKAAAQVDSKVLITYILPPSEK